MDLLRRKLLESKSQLLAVLVSRIRDTISKSEKIPELSNYAKSLGAYWFEIEKVLAELFARRGATRYDNATDFLKAFGHGVVGWMFLDQYLAADAAGLDAIAESVEANCRFFFEHEIPTGYAWLAIMVQATGELAEYSDSIFR